MMNPVEEEGLVPTFHVGGVTVFKQDAIVGMRSLKENSVDLAIADPPYGAFSARPSELPAGHALEGFGGAWRAASHKWDKIGPKQQLEFTVEWLSELQRVVSPEGSIWIHSSYHNGGFMNVASQLLGLEIINEVVWYKRNAFPNLKGTRLTASHETILWVHTGTAKKRGYRFNYDAVKAAEYPEDLIKQAGKQLRTVWDIPNNKTPSEISFGRHPTQKPERLIQRLIDISGVAGGTLLSPFSGSGTDLVVGMRNGMKGIGYELETEYVDLSRRRLEAEFEANQTRADSGGPI